MYIYWVYLDEFHHDPRHQTCFLFRHWFIIPPHSWPKRKIFSVCSAENPQKFDLQETMVFTSIGWYKGKSTGKSHISWENLWFPVDFPFN